MTEGWAFPVLSAGGLTGGGVGASFSRSAMSDSVLARSTTSMTSPTTPSADSGLALALAPTVSILPVTLTDNRLAISMVVNTPL